MQLEQSKRVEEGSGDEASRHGENSSFCFRMGRLGGVEGFEQGSDVIQSSFNKLPLAILRTGCRDKSENRAQNLEVIVVGQAKRPVEAGLAAGWRWEKQSGSGWRLECGNC